jgi:hypothetical protein
MKKKAGQRKIFINALAIAKTGEIELSAQIGD